MFSVVNSLETHRNYLKKHVKTCKNDQIFHTKDHKKFSRLPLWLLSLHGGSLKLRVQSCPFLNQILASFFLSFFFSLPPNYAVESTINNLISGSVRFGSRDFGNMTAEVRSYWCLPENLILIHHRNFLIHTYSYTPKPSTGLKLNITQLLTR